METKLFNQNWKEIWNIDLNESIFWLEVNEWLIHRALVYQLSNNRNSNAHSKTRGERRGSTRKIYKQKWTGRARAWANRSPVRKKGWVAFWPRNNVNYTLLMNKKERRKALFCALSSKFKNNQIIIIDDIIFDEIKTKNMINVLSSFPCEKNILLALDNKNEILEKSISNLPYAKSLLVNYLNIKDLLKYKTLILLKWTLDNLNSLV